MFQKRFFSAILTISYFLLILSNSLAIDHDLSWRFLSSNKPSIEESSLKLFPEAIQKIDSAWTMFKSEFKREYTSDLEEIKRYYEFAKNFVSVMEHNIRYMNNQTSFMVGINEFSDRFSHEMIKMRGFRMSTRTPEKGADMLGSTYTPPRYVGELPSSVDWRKEGAVTAVKNQGQCGSCWAFSTTGAVEGHHYIHAKKSVDLSEQQLVDCSASYGNMGCNGGLMDNAFKYLRDNNRGADTERSYPYVSGTTGQAQDFCQYKRRYVGATVKGFHDIKSGSEEDLKMAIANNGPVSVAIDASHMSFQMYQHGIYEEPECSPLSLDHGVLVVGYGSENGIPYWIVKNSWGSQWGEDGYVRMRRNKKNMCGIATQASFPLV